jgi:hypothetical protein
MTTTVRDAREQRYFKSTAARPASEQQPCFGNQCRLFHARWAGPAAFILLAGYLLFAHGCHGDQDNELFGVVSRLATTLSAPK